MGHADPETEATGSGRAGHGHGLEGERQRVATLDGHDRRPEVDVGDPVRHDGERGERIEMEALGKPDGVEPIVGGGLGASHRLVHGGRIVATKQRDPHVGIMA